MPHAPPILGRDAAPGLALGLLLALLPALSLGGALGTSFLGSPTPDLFDHVFLFEDALRDLAAGHLFPLTTSEIRGPQGGVLAMPDPVGALLYMGLRQALPRALAFNLALITGLGAGALGAGLIARRLGARAGGVLVAAALFGGSSFAYAQLHNGETETLRLGALSFGILGLLRARAALLTPQGGWRDPLLGGAGLGLAFFACWYYGAYLLIIAGVGLGFDLLPRLWGRGALRGALPRLSAAALAAAALLVPQALRLRGALAAQDSLFKMPTVAELLKADPLALGASSADLANIASPGALAPHEGYLHGGFIGAVALALALGALLAHPRGARGPLALAAAFFLLALGPTLHIGGEVAFAAGSPVALPYGHLSEALPYFGSMRLPYRALALVHLGVALAGGVALHRLIPWLRGPAGMLPGALIALAVAADVALFSGLSLAPASVTIPPHPGAGALGDAGVATSAGILDLPMGFLQRDLRGVYLAQQPDHGRWIPYSLMSTQLSPELATNDLVVALGALDPALTARPLRAREGSDLDQLIGRIEGALLDPSLAPDAPRRAAGAEALASLGLGAVALHTEGLGPAYGPYRALLQAQLGPPAFEGEGIEIYALSPNPSPPTAP